jgi:hypothetical protein
VIPYVINTDRVFGTRTSLKPHPALPPRLSQWLPREKVVEEGFLDRAGPGIIEVGYCLPVNSAPTGWTEEWLMIDALFWYTGFAAWCLIIFGVVLTLVVEAHDRSVLRRGQQLRRR